MRENIGLFKAKRRDNGEWVEGYFYKTPHPITAFPVYYIASEPIFNENNESFRQDVNMIHKHTLSQYTGLKDKNGVKIFENDIIKFENGAEYEIIFEDYMFKISNETHKEALFESEFDDIEIIGNKFEEVESES